MIFNAKNKKKQISDDAEATSEPVTENNNENTLSINDLFSHCYLYNLNKVEEVVFEVYRESKTSEDWEVPGTFIGIRIYEDGEMKEDFVLHNFANFGLFSLTVATRYATNMKLAIDISDALANNVPFGQEMHRHKIKKRFVSDLYIYLLDIPIEYELVTPEPNPYFEKMLEMELEMNNLQAKKELNPNLDISRDMTHVQKKMDELRHSH